MLAGPTVVRLGELFLAWSATMINVHPGNQQQCLSQAPDGLPHTLLSSIPVGRSSDPASLQFPGKEINKKANNGVVKNAWLTSNISAILTADGNE